MVRLRDRVPPERDTDLDSVTELVSDILRVSSEMVTDRDTEIVSDSVTVGE